MKEAERLGIPIPKTYYPDDVGIEAVARAIPAYPVVLKPCISNGARGISYPRDAEELKSLYEKTRAEYKACIGEAFTPSRGACNTRRRSSSTQTAKSWWAGCMTNLVSIRLPVVPAR